MNQEIIPIDTITHCNCFFHRPTLHPSVCLIDIPAECCQALVQLDFYAVLLKENADEGCFGCKSYDFAAGTLAFVAPGQPINLSKWIGRQHAKRTMLGFHPEWIWQTALGSHFQEYTFFHYRPNEALHLSCRELRTYRAAMDNLAEELEWGVDKFTDKILTGKIDVLMNYGKRFYQRQFITRHEANQRILTRTDELLDNYLLTGQARQNGLPGAEYFARRHLLSPAYFEDLLLNETGKSVKDYVHLRQFDIACSQLLRTGKSTTCIAKELGYSSAQHFCHIFKCMKGCSPESYRMLN